MSLREGARVACMSINSKVFEEPYSSTYRLWNRKEEKTLNIC